MQSKQNLHYEFRFLKGDEALEFTKSADKISGYRCSCGKEKCEHLCAAILYLQSDVFESLTQKEKKVKVKVNLFKTYCKKIGEKLKKKGIDQKVLTDLKLNDDKTVYYHLALLKEISVRFSGPISSDDPLLIQLMNFSELFLKRAVRSGLTNEEVQAFIEATKNSVTGVKIFNTRLFAFLILLLLRLQTNSGELKEIRELLRKKKLKQRFPSELNWQLISEYCLDIKTGTKHGQDKTRAEYFIANAEFDFAIEKTARAFKNLEEGFASLSKRKPAAYISFIEYVILKAKEYKHESAEVEFIGYHFLNDSFIHPLYVERLNQLLDHKAKEIFINKILKALLLDAKDNFSKISELLWCEGRYEELLQQLEKKHNKFRLINQVFIKMAPYIPAKYFNLYAKHFKEAVSEALETHYQEHIFNNAKMLLDLLDLKQRNVLLGKLLEETGRHSYLRSYILKCYPLAD